MPSLILAALLLLLAGCAGPATYRYANHILIPPGVKNAAVSQRAVTIPVAASCSSSEGGLDMSNRGRAVHVTVKTAPLLAHPPGWLSSWATSLEKRGCLRIGDGGVVAARVVEAVPLDPRAAFNLIHPSVLTAGYVDVGPEHRLKVVGPILREGAPPGASAISSAAAPVAGNDGKLTVTLHSSKDFLGYETAWFGIQPLADRPGARIVALSTEDNLGGKLTHPSKPQLDYFQFPADAAFYRLFYLTRISRADHDIAVLAAPTQAELEELTQRFAADPEICASIAGRCILIPRESAVVPHIVVTAAGSEIPVVTGGTVRDALKAAGVPKPEAVLPTLAVQRRYAGRPVPVLFNRTQPEILDLPLNGGEDIRW
ncbi:MAG TPA: hypothetical protein VEU96_26850 [Bryobacteraceae bacterium]|nr:hypothetical protein [Bryobacteraceae bacterium]